MVTNNLVTHPTIPGGNVACAFVTKALVTKYIATDDVVAFTFVTLGKNAVVTHPTVFSVIENRKVVM